ncbi:CDP-glycerol glycerophosphotransferase [Microbacterium halimionae]|uniref:CDP-glycerol glycerophosphotransferase n=1 Tax=Microbacterium halimionae TaxID=1526413 RepID=A0A7W3JN77_9MICO|nr:glycosyltransferase family 2 protein [Microbacterium halimionae]MBA8815869.1 CDP-glycerol glycerophosphotransferase [Microbacterium halimionae]NII95915.1 CDP-glycerol glycerophosphotransferase [Microbacterium halimionae]
MSPALVTVIVPGFNVARYVAEAIDSLRAQTMTAWQAILVDDGSTDATGTRFDEATTTDPRFRVVHHPFRRGLGAARNTGLDLVDTEFVAFLDADDVLTETALERMVATVQRTGSDLVTGAYVRLRPQPDGTYLRGDVQPWVSASTSPARDAATLVTHPEVTANVVAWSKVTRSSLWERLSLRFPNDQLYEDQAIAQHLYVGARAFDVIPDVVALWRVRADGSSITQAEANLTVLTACITAMRDGIDVLDATGSTAAASARIGQILRMDVPRLVEIAGSHPDPVYRATLGAFTRELIARVPAGEALKKSIIAASAW